MTSMKKVWQEHKYGISASICSVIEILLIGYQTGGVLTVIMIAVMMFFMLRFMLQSDEINWKDLCTVIIIAILLILRGACVPMLMAYLWSMLYPKFIFEE